MAPLDWRARGGRGRVEGRRRVAEGSGEEGPQRSAGSMDFED